jgi:hypothetical protein
MGTEGLQIKPERHSSYAVLSCGNGKDAIPAGFPVLRSTSLHSARELRHLFVLCTALHLPEVASLVANMNREHKLQALFVKTDTDPKLLPQMLERANLRTLRNVLVHSDSRLPRRVLSAWMHNAQAELIANADVADDRLVVISCEPKTYELGFHQMPALKRIPTRERRSFEIDDDGSFISWPASDIDLDLDAIRSVVDPKWRRKSERMRRAHGREYGTAISRLRQERGLKQTEVQGLSERQLRRIERSGEVSVQSLKLLASAHGMKLNRYLNAVAQKVSLPDSRDTSSEPPQSP